MNIAIKYTVSYCSKLVDYCLSLQSLVCAQSVHVQLIKVGFDRHTFLGNRLISLYSQLGAVASSFKVFHNVPDKNTFTWNILLSACSKSGDMESALRLFEEMPERDVVSWNSMISGYVTIGHVAKAFGLLFQMQELNVKATGFTLSIAASCITSVHQAKQIHGHAIRVYLNSLSVVLSNTLIDMYGRLRLVDYASLVFLSMGVCDVISWNTMILAYARSGYMEWTLGCFKSMWHAGVFPDKFTMSIVISACADLRDLDMGEQTFALSFKMGYLSNSVVSSCVINMFSQCGRLDYSVQFFNGIAKWDSAICNSMISGYARNQLTQEAQKLMVMALRKGLKPTEFTFAIILSSISGLVPINLISQVHSLVLKSGSEIDIVIASSLLNIYAKCGAIESATKIFSKITTKDLVCWNTMIISFAENGHGLEALRIFEELLEEGAQPDPITMTGVLTACSLAGLVKEGTHLFSSMERKYEIRPQIKHYAWMVDMMSRAKMLTEATEFIEVMPHKHCPLFCVMLLEACNIYGNFKFAEAAAKRAVELQSHSSLPYSILAHIYGARGQWESMAWVWKVMKDRGVKEEIDCSNIPVRNQTFVFRADQVLHCGGESLYSMLKLLGAQVHEVMDDPRQGPFLLDPEEQA